MVGGAARKEVANQIYSTPPPRPVIHDHSHSSFIPYKITITFATLYTITNIYKITITFATLHKITITFAILYKITIITFATLQNYNNICNT